MTIEEFTQIQAEMSDDELIGKVEKELQRLCKTGGQSFHMRVPPHKDDSDMLISELIRRYKAKL